MGLVVSVGKRLKHFDVRMSFSCACGELTAVVGPSGAGKTTLVRLIAGLERPDCGTVTLGGRVWTDTASGRSLPLQERGASLVFQDYTLFPHMSVRNNVAFAARDMEVAERYMDMFGVLHLADSRPGSISGGERQRVAFCQALAREPRLLLLDEPFSALDIATRRNVRSRLRELKRELGIPMVHVTHDLEEAAYLGDAILAMDRGCAAPDWLERQIRFHDNPEPAAIRAAL
ncbi:ATP-binding cassette domain-containing protein [Salidesulfovibrio onnuriiensis]|uniref:ATP-binding cassette domain-containing protein n=1 Tax=Salidesulfovibrio onnuriiensis TaxID=2583823 RepID=UPI0011C8BFCC|nr:ATP-binding cassette domain-containing protein [Salidesulfovibrio onnuriiensis]